MRHSRYRTSLRARLIGLALFTIAVSAYGTAWAQETVTEVWVHDVPEPPGRDFWDPVTGNLFSTITNPASIYPDVLVCVRAASGSTRTCTQPVCWNLQGDTKRGGAGTSTDCRRKLRLTLPANDTRMVVQVLEMDDDVGQQRLHEVIGAMTIADPTTCTDVKPCATKTARGTLALSFSVKPAFGPPAPPTTTPPSTQGACTPSPNAADRLHGPYARMEDVMTRDPVGPLTLLLTGSGVAEYGFVILQNRKSGGYYATSPARSTQAGASCFQRPMIGWPDYATSVNNAFAASCANLDDYVIVADVHTHPNCYTLSNSFSATDFNQAITFKNSPPPDIAKWLQFEKIFMISDADHQVRMFEAHSDDLPLSAYDVWLADTLGLPYLSRGWLSNGWYTYQQRVEWITTYP